MFWKSFLDLTNHHYCIERKNIYSFIAKHIRTFCHEKRWTVFSKQNNKVKKSPQKTVLLTFSKIIFVFKKNLKSNYK